MRFKNLERKDVAFFAGILLVALVMGTFLVAAPVFVERFSAPPAGCTYVGASEDPSDPSEILTFWDCDGSIYAESIPRRPRRW